MAVLGITTTENWDAYRDKNRRRGVQYMYPQGKFPLLGLLSLVDSDEETNDPYYSHWETRWHLPRTVTANKGSGVGSFTNDIDADPGNTFTATAGTEYFVYCTSGDETKFFTGDVIRIMVDITSYTNKQLLGLVTNVSSAGKIKFRAVNTVASILNDDSSAQNVGKAITLAGNAYAEGKSNVAIQQRAEVPVEFYNYPQIHRTKVAFTRREMKAPVVFDKSGTYRSRTRDQLLRHMVGIEQAIMWGERRKETVSDTVLGATGTSTVLTYNGGIYWYLKQWEAQYSLYRGGDGTSTGPAEVTADTDDEKRIIENTTGVMTEDLWDTLMERCFRFTSNTSTEKLWIGGNKQLLVLNQLARSKQQLIREIDDRKSTYGYQMFEWTTPFGTLYLKTHPLFNDQPHLNYDAFILDVKNIKYRAFKDSDTVLLKNRVNDADADGIVNEWFSDCGIEMWQPESCMYIRNVQSFMP